MCEETIDNEANSNNYMYFLLSVFVHAGIFWAIILMESYEDVSERDEPLIVELQEVEEVIKDVFAGNKDNRVEEQTIAKRRPHNIFLEKSKLLPTPPQPIPNRKLYAKPGEGKNVRRKGQISFRPTLPTENFLPFSVERELPPGVKLGNITALNTDANRFYSFLFRMNSRFIPEWGSQVGKALRVWLQRNSQPKTNRTWVTNVEVIMDKKGEVLDVQHYRMSGFWDLDVAPVVAFKEVKQIPNPPTEMVDDDGYIRLKYQLSVHWVPQPAINISRPRSY